ncbi:MAG: exopolyphosphatase [Gammaproteobacteria bacterium]|nr:MAG: exopolyphosphatase [Gammaproteobacteria bacterium]
MLTTLGFRKQRGSRPGERSGGDTAEVIAAVDLGSNSFHMKVARVVDGQLAVIDRMRDVVRLAAGLNERRKLREKAYQRALETLQRFGQRLRDVPSDNVRAVGTNTLRRARNSDAFLADAQAALGHPIEVISGREEARLIYLGVAHSSAPDAGRRLVVDIGGGSTELIIGEQFEALRTESLYMGCVGMSREFFPGGVIDARRMRQAELAARQELAGAEESYRRLGWDSAIGASGTVRNVWQVLHDQEWSRKGVTAKGMKKLRDALVQAGHAERLNLRGLQPERAPVFAGGVAILAAVFDALGVKTMGCSDGALREGLLYDLIGRLGYLDVRQATIDNLCGRYRAQQEQARRVAASAALLLDRVADTWGLGEQRYAHLLEWAARLHEIGLDIAHGGYHRHGAYVLRNADLPGFSRQEQAEVAALVQVHRRKFDVRQFDDVPRNHRSRLLSLAVLLRIAVLMHRGRQDVDLAGVHVEAGEGLLRLGFPEKWLSEHPLTEADLAREKAYLKAAGVELRIGGQT